MKFQLFLPIVIASALAVSSTASVAQVEVGPSGVLVGAHHEQDGGSHGHAAPIGRGDHDNGHAQTHGRGHGNAPAVIIEGGHRGHADRRGGHGDDHH